MTDESAFLLAMDAATSDDELLGIYGVYADWLEEQRENEKAAGYRWMHQMAKRPFASRNNTAAKSRMAAAWFVRKKKLLRHLSYCRDVKAIVPIQLFDILRNFKAITPYRWFDNRRAAELALCAALAKVQQEPAA